MILKKECGCVEYEHGNELCARHAKMSPLERTRDVIQNEMWQPGHLNPMTAVNARQQTGADHYAAGPGTATPQRNVFDMNTKCEHGYLNGSCPRDDCREGKPWLANPNAKIGIGGGPIRVTIIPDDPAERKRYPIATGVLDYFPDAIAEIARVSWQGNEQHNPGQPLHWDRSKSQDEADTAMRHFMARGTRDKDGTRHMAKAAWRFLALLQKEIEEEQAKERVA